MGTCRFPARKKIREAAEADESALALAPNGPEPTFLERRVAEVRSRGVS